MSILNDQPGEAFVMMDDDLPCVIYPLKSVEGWERCFPKDYACGRFNGSGGKYTLLNHMDSVFMRALLVNLDTVVEFYGYFQSYFYVRTTTFRGLCIELGVSNVVHRSKMGLFCMKMQAPAFSPSTSATPEPVRLKRTLAMRLSGVSVSSVVAFQGSGETIGQISVGNVDYIITRDILNEVEVSVCDEVKGYFFRLVLADRGRFEYFDHHTYEGASYVKWSMNTHSSFAKSFCTQFSDYHLIVPGDGFGLFAQFARSYTGGDIVLTEFSSRKLKRESCVQTISRGLTESVRPCVIVLSYLWNLLSDDERDSIYDLDKIKFVIDSVPPISPFYPKWFLVGPGVWCSHPIPIAVDDFVSEKDNLDPIVPYSENFVRESPKVTYGTFSTWLKSFDILGAHLTGQAHTRISTILQCTKEDRPQCYFIQTGRRFSCQRVSMSPFMHLEPRVVYVTRSKGTFFPLIKQIAHEVCGEDIYFWFHSLGVVEVRSDGLFLQVNVCSKRKPSVSLLQEIDGAFSVLVNDGPPVIWELNTSSLESVRNTYGDVEADNLLREVLLRNRDLPKSSLFSVTETSEMFRNSTLHENLYTGDLVRAYKSHLLVHIRSSDPSLVQPIPLIDAFDSNSLRIVTWCEILRENPHLKRPVFLEKFRGIFFNDQGSDTIVYPIKPWTAITGLRTDSKMDLVSST